ncbi:MAG TPA: polymer-forming cytoskeletal protein [Dissulfurispiraceae bacterium]|nr:polymer-forming cytoskeletal protein [Dissulfurispiraceae bacterium]
MWFKRANNGKLESLIGGNSVIEGNITVQGMLRIDGKIAGAVKADAVILGDAGTIAGDVSARCVVVGGRIDGNVHADENVEIKPKGKLIGDVYTRKLAVAEGGVFEGRSHVHRDDDVTNVVEFPSRELLSR